MSSVTTAWPSRPPAASTRTAAFEFRDVVKGSAMAAARRSEICRFWRGVKPERNAGPTADPTIEKSSSTSWRSTERPRTSAFAV